MLGWFLGIAILLAFIFIDLWYFLRFIPFYIRLLVLKSKKGSLKNQSWEDVLGSTIVEGIVLPSDLDLNLHMNNSKYLREMDFGRIFHIVMTGLYDAVKAERALITVAAINIRYRRSLQLWDRFQLHTRLIYWDDQEFYFEQRFIDKNGFVCAVALVKTAVRRTNTKQVFEAVCGNGCPEKPPRLSHLEAWIQALQKSSEILRTELNS